MPILLLKGYTNPFRLGNIASLNKRVKGCKRKDKTLSENRSPINTRGIPGSRNTLAVFLTFHYRKSTLYHNRKEGQVLTGNNFIENLILPSRNGLTALKDHASGLNKPSLRFFLISIIDLESEMLKDMEEIFTSAGISEIAGTASPKINELISEITAPFSLQEDDVRLLRGLSERYELAYELFSFLSSAVDDASIKDSLTNIASEQRKQIQIINDRISLEELTN